jgi:uridylate kinase
LKSIANRGRFLSVSLGATSSPKDALVDVVATRETASQLKELALLGFGVIAVVGAGGLGRQYLAMAKRYTNENRALDEVGIEASRINASMLINSFHLPHSFLVNQEPLRTLSQVKSYISRLHETRDPREHHIFEERGFVAITGGLEPGLTSDSSAAKVATELDCPLIIVSTMGGIFESDPLATVAKGRESPKLLSRIGRDYLKTVILKRAEKKGDEQESEGNETPHVLDVPTCRILLDVERERRATFRAAVTNYKAIAETALILTSRKTPAVRPKRPHFTLISLL